jgi:PhnB protein
VHLFPHLIFDGCCEEAFRFYAAVLGGEVVTLLRYGDSPLASRVPEAWRGRIAHATLTAGWVTLSGGDAMPESYQKPQGMAVLLNIETTAEAERIFAELVEGGTVTLPLQESFWAQRFGMLTDRFGTPWMINCGKTD